MASLQFGASEYLSKATHALVMEALGDDDWLLSLIRISLTCHRTLSSAWHNLGHICANFYTNVFFATMSVSIGAHSC